MNEIIKGKENSYRWAKRKERLQSKLKNILNFLLIWMATHSMMNMKTKFIFSSILSLTSFPSLIFWCCQLKIRRKFVKCHIIRKWWAKIIIAINEILSFKAVSIAKAILIQFLSFFDFTYVNIEQMAKTIFFPELLAF